MNYRARLSVSLLLLCLLPGFKATALPAVRWLYPAALKIGPPGTEAGKAPLSFPQLKQAEARLNQHLQNYERTGSITELYQAVPVFEAVKVPLSCAREGLPLQSYTPEQMAFLFALYEQKVCLQYHLYKATSKEEHLQQLLHYAEYGKQYYGPITGRDAPILPAQASGGILNLLKQKCSEEGYGIVYYFLGRKSLVMVSITAEGVNASLKPINKALEKRIERLRSGISSWPAEQQEEALRLYAEEAYQLYQILYQPVEYSLPERVVLITQAYLRELPFDALLYRPVEEALTALSDYPFLIRRHQFSYREGLSELLYEPQRTTDALQQKVLAYAPSVVGVFSSAESGSTEQYPLSRALRSHLQEVDAIRSIWPAELRKEADATRAQFLKEAGQYAVIHLATHARRGGSEQHEPYIGLHAAPGQADSGRLGTRCLQPLQLAAEMVVLSTCESNLERAPFMSLAQSFQRAGAESSIATLWKIEDGTAAEFMTAFYEELSLKIPKDEALRRAKLRYINYNGGLFAHPFYWAAYVANGNMRPLRMQPKYTASTWLWPGIIIIGILSFYARKRF
jgi:CHAT domain-containing protein